MERDELLKLQEEHKKSANNFKCIKIAIDDNKLTMEFLGNNVDREDFTEESIEYLWACWFDCVQGYVMRILMEAIKNVYDHGTGKATLTLIRDGDDYEFEFIDHNPKIINFQEICKLNKDNGWIKKSDQNCNVGVDMIMDLSKELYSFSIDDTKGGINYKGIYRHKK